MAKINKKKFVKAMEGSGGILANIARKLNVSRSAVTQFVQNHEDIRDLLAQEDENINDLAEAKLITKLNEGDMQAIKFRLTTKGKYRGYVERQELEHIGDNNFKIDINISNEAKKVFELEQKKVKELND